MMVILMALQWLDNIMAIPFHPATFPQAIRSSFILIQTEVEQELDLNLNIIHPVRHKDFFVAPSYGCLPLGIQTA